MPIQIDFSRRAVRQGDVAVVPIVALPETATKAVAPEAGRLVLAHGEATGHHHSFAFSERVAMFREDGSGGGLFLSVSAVAPAALEHQEHAALPVASGPHQVIRQRTFVAGLARRVAD